ncbi:myocardin-related transcription factor A isoform X3 [Crotalus tigris]|uniref:myocardin-related transcription factor A isoform X3 n=1 Tax=Crotalus tigris TaxID=88082 RepID=UPI00192F8687|nr:myocardin-related transcription factor A isoform X3 [Crotalus tigris]
MGQGTAPLKKHKPGLLGVWPRSPRSFRFSRCEDRGEPPPFVLGTSRLNSRCRRTLFNFSFSESEAVIKKAKVDFSGVLCLPPSVIAGNGLDGGGVGENEDETLSVSLSAAPSPQSEAVANELQELSLQPELTVGLHLGRNPNLPPLSERKNDWPEGEECNIFIHGTIKVLQLKLQQRRTREELVSQGIMPPQETSLSHTYSFSGLSFLLSDHWPVCRSSFCLPRSFSHSITISFFYIGSILENILAIEALKSPAAFHEQRRSLERARTEDYLKRKIRSRPERSELVRMHILEETSAEPSLQAKQLKLKRARLADDLNEKIAQRPGPMELVEKNILPVESSLKEALIVGQVDYPKLADNSSFDEDSSDALSPEQPASHESQASVPSPMDALMSDLVPTPTVASPAQIVCQLKISTDCTETTYVSEQPPTPLPQPPPPVPLNLTNGIAPAAAKPLPTLIKQSQTKSSCEKSQRSKKSKEPKPKVKKLKYHQYIPPDQKQDKGAPPMDSSYAKILQQQQLFLQLQILNQQHQQHYNYQTILPAPPKPLGEQNGNSTPALRNLSSAASNASSLSSSSNGLLRQNSNSPVGKPGALPTNLDDMKVAELKQELKLRALPVSGTKTDLIERLKAYQEQNGITSRVIAAPKANTAILPKTTEVVVTFPAARLSTGPALVNTGLTSAEVVVATVTGNGVMKFGSTGSTPPVSPTPSERSLISAGDENSISGDTFGEMVTSPLTQLTLQASPVQFLVKEESSKGNTCSTNAMSRVESSMNNNKDMEVQDKDQMLQEKDKQIEELTRMLKQKQQLVEMLKLQLEKEKRSQQPLSATVVGEEDRATVCEPSIFGTSVKNEKGFVSCQSVEQLNCQIDQLRPTQTTSQMETSDTNLVPKKAVMVKQEVLAAETEPSCQTSCFFLGQQAGGFSDFIKGASPPTLITDSTGTHIVLTVTNQNAERQNLSPQEKVGSSSLPLKRISSPSTIAPSKPLIKNSPSSPEPPPKESTQKFLSQPSSPAPPSPPHMDLEQQKQSPSFFGTLPPLLLPATSVAMKEPPGYEEAVKQQPKSSEENGCSSQQMDDLFDILIEHGEISAQFKESPSAKKDPTVTPKCLSPSSNHHSSELCLQGPVSHPSSVNPPGRLEDFLESTTGLSLLTAVPDGTEPLIDLYSEMLSSSAILDQPSSPMDTSELHFAPESAGGPGLDLAEPNLDSMDWLELSGGPVMSLTPLSSATPSLFSTDFLDGHDLQLHWDSCL